MGFLDRYKAEKLKNPEFKKAYEESQPYYDIARVIIQARKRRGLTQRQLATRLKTKQSAISRIENGDQNMSLRMLDKLARELGGNVEIKVNFKDDKVKN